MIRRRWFSSVRLLRARPGDVVVVTYPGPFDPARAESCRAGA